MRSWLILPVLALSAWGAFAFSGDTAVTETAVAPAETRVAALQQTATLTDACVWTPEASTVGQPDPCAVQTAAAEAIEATKPSGKALVWPDDFVELTAQAVADAYEAAAGLLSDLYRFAFESEEAAKKADS